MRKITRFILGLLLIGLALYGCLCALRTSPYLPGLALKIFLFSGFLMVIALFMLLCRREKKSKRIKRVFIFFDVIIFISAASFISLFVTLKLNSYRKDTNTPDYVIILGAGLYGDYPSQILRYRLDSGVELLSNLPEDVKVIVSGGQGPGETITEAEAMKRYLVDKGIDEARIIKEEASTNTLENLENSMDLIKKIDSKEDLSITLVTSTFHTYRSRLLADRVGFHKVYCWNAPVNSNIEGSYYFRECFALAKSLVFDWPNEDLVLDEYKNVKVYDNGINFLKNHGTNYSEDGYYYGYKWQCVEFIKRFYYEAKDHKMPNVYGHAKDFFDTNLGQGEFNKDRGLYQYKNGGNVKPEVDDLIVFQDSTYGHVAIISEVGDDYIEVVQQNIYKKPRAKYPLKEENGCYYVDDGKSPAGWLRLIN